MACERGHTHLIVFTHACGYYSRAATISLAELQVQLLFKDGYYSECGFYSNKYGISTKQEFKYILKLHHVYANETQNHISTTNSCSRIFHNNYVSEFEKRGNFAHLLNFVLKSSYLWNHI